MTVHGVAGNVLLGEIVLPRTNLVEELRSRLCRGVTADCRVSILTSDARLVTDGFEFEGDRLELSAAFAPWYQVGETFEGFECELPTSEFGAIPDGCEWRLFQHQGRYKLVDVNIAALG